MTNLLDDLAEVVRLDDPACPNYTAALTFIRTHHATIRDMSARLESAERDAERWRIARNNESDGLRIILWHHDEPEEIQVMFPSPLLCDDYADEAMQETGR